MAEPQVSYKCELVPSMKPIPSTSLPFCIVPYVCTHVYMYVYYHCVCSLIRITLLGCGHSVTVKIIFNVLLWVVVTPTQWERLLSQGLSVYLYVCVFAIVCVCVCVCLSVCLSICICVCVSVSLSLSVSVCRGLCACIRV